MLYFDFWVSFWKSWSELAPAADKKNQFGKPDADIPAPDDNCAYLSEYIMQQNEMTKQARDQILASMNHDLRTPLNAVIGFAQIIESEIFGKVNPQYLEYARHIQESGYELLARIEDLLDHPSEQNDDVPVTPRAPTQKIKKLATAD